MSRAPACLGLLAAFLVAGCATPAERAAEQARRLGLQRRVLQTGEYPITTYAPPWRSSQQGPPPRRIHVYLEGDASPRQAGRTGRADPTPTDAVAFRLLAQDGADRVLVGRPCTHGAPPCSPRLWTLARYGETVVQSLAAAIDQLARERDAAQVVLIGYSGGGTLAMLLAARLPAVVAVVTVAGNLDPDAWAAHHGYVPLEGSLSPAREDPLPERVFQLHLLGGRDRNVPPALSRAALERQPGARSRVHPGFDHRCCWASVWPEVLGELGRALRTGSAPPP